MSYKDDLRDYCLRALNGTLTEEELLIRKEFAESYAKTCAEMTADNEIVKRFESRRIAKEYPVIYRQYKQIED
jgi:hypothetical protein